MNMFFCLKHYLFLYLLPLLIVAFNTTAVCAQSQFLKAAYPRSQKIMGLSFDMPTQKTLAPGSDNWAITWADNGHQYTAWGDGGGFGGTNNDGRVKMGVGRVEGGKDNYRGVNVWGGYEPKHPGGFDGKSYGIISINGILYMWVAHFGSDHFLYTKQELYRSKNYGSSWSSTGVIFDQNSFSDFGFFTPTFLQFGKDYANARDGYVYIYAPEIKNDTNWNVQKPGEITLMRVPKNQLEKKSKYEFFAGFDSDGNPKWSANGNQRKSVFEDAANGVMRTSVSYNAGLKRYFLITQHVDRYKSNGAYMGIYEAPEPWGPWNTVLFGDPFQLGLQSDKGQRKTVYWNFSNKWLSKNGKDFVLVYTDADEWATVEGSFIASPDQTPSRSDSINRPYPPSHFIKDIELDWSTHQRAAQGSDNFQLTWADDGHQHGWWGDGGGFGGTNSDGRVGLGFARIEGSGNNWIGYNVWGGKKAENLAQFDGKSWGTICVAGVLYSWIVPDNPDTREKRNHYRYIELASSTDYGASWEKADWRWWIEDNVIIPTFLNFDKNNNHSRDDYIYSYFIRPQNKNITQQTFGLEIHKPGAIFLARVHKHSIFEGRDHYQWYTGMKDVKPVWGTLDAKKSVFEDSNGTGWCMSAAYIPGLDRYLLCTEHARSHSSLLGIFDAPEPWGPWTTVKYWNEENRFGENREGSDLDWNFNVFFLAFPPK